MLKPHVTMLPWTLQGFVRKVFGILAVQLALTVGITAAFVFRSVPRLSLLHVSHVSTWQGRDGMANWTHSSEHMLPIILAHASCAITCHVAGTACPANLDQALTAMLS